MPSDTEYLLQLGREVLAPYTALPNVAATAIHGSVSEGLTDEYSDLDMTVYYHQLPDEPLIREIREHLQAGPITWGVGTHAEGAFAEGFRFKGVECQIGHTNVAQWESEIAGVLGGKDVASPLNKAMSGALLSIPIAGPDLIEKWKEQLRAYPDKLATAMVEHHLKFFAIWALVDRLERRDAFLWTRQTLLDSSFNILGILAGLNRKYFTTFQFKRAGSFIGALKICPVNLSKRLDALWTVDCRRAAEQLHALVDEVTALVETHMPGVDTTAPRKALARKDHPWRS